MLLNEFILYHALDLLWVVLGNVRDTLATRAYEALECQVVARGQWVVLVGLNQATSILTSALIKWVFIEHDL